MKSLFAALSFLLLLTFSSCKKNDDNSTLSPNTVNSTVSTGDWRITYYYDTDHEETSNYSGYLFRFANGGAVTATKNGATVNGTWATGVDDSKTKLILTFSTPSSFVELSDDWHVTEQTATRIKLQDVSGGNGGTDYLTFEKN